MKKFLLWLVVVAVLAGLYAMPGMVEKSIPSIYYVTPNRKSYENVVSCTGTILSATVQEIYLQTGVVVGEVFVEIGDEVWAGQVLCALDAEKTRALSANTLSLVQDITGQSSPMQSLSEIDWESLVSLVGLSTALGGEIDTAVLQSLLGELQKQEAGESVGSWVDSAVQTRIIAPISGIVTGVQIAPNLPAAAGKAIFTISDNRNYQVMAAVAESDIAKISIGNEAQVRCVGYANKVYTGTVTKIYPTARKALNGTSAETVIDVVIELGNADSNLRPGFSAKVEIAGGEDYELITVPYEAVRQDENNEEYVYVYEDGKIRKAPITTGQELTNEVEVLHGLSTDAIVVYNPSDIVKEGTMISLKGRADID